MTGSKVIANMSQVQINEYKRSRRNQSRVKVREALFISEYVETKYNSIYKEAATMYNSINKRYPNKPDLRRSAEFRGWKNAMKQRGKSTTDLHQKHERMTYKDISLSSMRLEIPLMSSSCSTPQPSAGEGQIEIETASHSNPSPVSENTGETLPVSENTGETLPVSENTGETLPVQQDTLNITTLFDQEIPQHIIDNIIKDLQSDPEMCDLMRDVEEQIEEELVGLEVDVPEISDPFADELNLLW